MHEPQGGWKKLLRFLADACFGNGFAEDGHALRALHLGTFPENGEGVLRVCRVAKERSEEAPVVLQNFQFRMEDDAEAFAKARLSFPFFTDRFGVGALHLIVIGENDRLFAGEVAINRPLADLQRIGDELHVGAGVPHLRKDAAGPAQDLLAAPVGRDDLVLARWERRQLVMKIGPGDPPRGAAGIAVHDPVPIDADPQPPAREPHSLSTVC